MLRDRIQPLIDWAKLAITQPRSQLTKWQQAARFAYDLARYGARQLREDRATHMAAALAFRTLFALIPITIVSTLVYGGLHGTDMLRHLVGNLVEVAGLHEVQITTAPDMVNENAEPMTLGEWVQSLVMRVSDINLQTLGWVGFAVMVYAAVAMMVTIENCFNVVYRAPQGRAWLRRLPIYWTVLTISPLAIALIIYVDAQVADYLVGMEAWQWLVTGLKAIWSIAVLWLLLLSIYMLLPNTAVSWRAAGIGSFVAAILLQIGRAALGAYIEHALTLQQIYGVIGLVPIFMLWVYVMWLAILFGLEVASTLQSLGGRQLDEMERRKRQRSGLIEPAAVLLVMERVAEAFEQSTPITAHEIAEQTAIPAGTVALMLDRLEEAGLIHCLDRDDHRVTLACPPEQISGDRLIEIGYELVDESGGEQKSELLEKLRESQRALARDLSLASLMRQRATHQVSEPT